MGECQGTTTAWDTHAPGYQPAQPAPPGFYYDNRGLPLEQQQPGAVNPFTGRDAHDANQDHTTYGRMHR